MSDKSMEKEDVGMVEVKEAKYRKTKSRQQILTELTSAQDSLERAANGMEQGGDHAHAHKTRNVAQSASARRCLMEQQWEIDDAAKRAARREKATK